jgi:hypothetical protein
MNNMMSHLRYLSKQIIQKQEILFTFHKIRFMGHFILGSLVQLHPIDSSIKNGKGVTLNSNTR